MKKTMKKKKLMNQGNLWLFEFGTELVSAGLARSELKCKAGFKKVVNFIQFVVSGLLHPQLFDFVFVPFVPNFPQRNTCGIALMWSGQDKWTLRARCWRLVVAVDPMHWKRASFPVPRVHSSSPESCRALFVACESVLNWNVNTQGATRIFDPSKEHMPAGMYDLANCVLQSSRADLRKSGGHGDFVPGDCCIVWPSCNKRLQEELAPQLANKACFIPSGREFTAQLSGRSSATGSSCQ